MTKLINVSFEVTDNWDIDGFRSFIKRIMSDDSFNIYIISNDDSSSYISSIGSKLGIPQNQVIVCNFTNDKINAINNNNINIHIDNLQSFTVLVEETTDAYGILVTSNLNRFYLVPDYVLLFDRTVELIRKNNE